MSKFQPNDADEVAYLDYVVHLIVTVVNTYKEAVGLPRTPLTQERIAGITDGVMKAWEHPEQTAQMNHNNWMNEMRARGWVVGDELSEDAKIHPALTDYESIPDLYKVNDLIFLAIANKHRPNLD